LYTDNRNFFGGKTREVAPLYAVQSGLSYTFAPGGWVALLVCESASRLLDFGSPDDFWDFDFRVGCRM
jgi:hypothetical protein